MGACQRLSSSRRTTRKLLSPIKHAGLGDVTGPGASRMPCFSRVSSSVPALASLRMLKWFSRYSQPAELRGMENLANKGSVTGAEWVLMQPAPCYSEGKTGEGGCARRPLALRAANTPHQPLVPLASEKKLCAPEIPFIVLFS